MENATKQQKKLITLDSPYGETVSREELVDTVKSLLEIIRGVQDSIVQMVNDTSGGNDQELRSHRTEMYRMHHALSSTLEQAKGDSATQLETALNDIRTEVNGLSSKIPKMPKMPDMNKVHSRISEVERKIPNLPQEKRAQDYKDALESLPEGEKLSIEAIEGLQKELDEMKRVGRSGGGVTNMRITQAFKYILHTEAPVGAVDGANTTYTLSQPIFAILSMSINGETIAQLPNYTIAGKSFTFSVALPSDYSGKDFEVKYV